MNGNGNPEEQEVWRRECAPAQEIGLNWLSVCVFVCILTVCLGTGGSPDGLFVSASSFRMWSVLMYESYRPSP